MRVFMLSAIAILSLAQLTVAQDDLPKVIKKSAPTKEEQDRRESLNKYVEGLKLEREEKFADALKAYQEAARLDPQASDVVRMQIPILIGMNRLAEAQEACKRVVTLDSADYKTWFLLAKLHKSAVHYNQAIAALEGALKSPTLKKHPEAAQGIYFELGALYEITEKFGSAADAFNKAAEILEHPDAIMAKGNFPRFLIEARAADTYEKISQLYRKAKRYDDSVTALTQAQKHSPDRAAALDFVIAQVRIEQGDFKKALTHVDAYLATRPLSIDPFETKIDILRRLKQDADILPWLETSAEREPLNSALQLVLAREYARAGQAKRAETIFKKQTAESPGPEAYRGLFRLYKDEGVVGMTRVLGMFDKVMDKAAQVDTPIPLGTVVHGKAMMIALRDDTELADALVDAAFKQKAETELKFDTVYFLAVLADRQRKHDAAERFYRQCLKSATTGNESLLYGGLLKSLNKARKHTAVIEVCEQGLKSAKSTNPLLFVNESARAMASLHRFDDALKQTDAGAAKAEGDGKFVFKLLRLRILAMAERFDQAETECQALIKGNDSQAEIVELRYLLSNIYSTGKHSAKSEEQLRLILKIDPQNATVNNDLGYLWADQGKNLELAEDMIRKAIEIDRLQRRRNPALTPAQDIDNAAYVDSLGWVLYRRGQVEEARKELERAAGLEGGNDPVIFDHLGEVYERLKMRPEANRAWHRAIELYEDGVRRKDAERVRDIQRKIQQVKD